MTLNEAPLGEERIVRELLCDDEELESFLFSLGCYQGQPITVISKRKSTLTVSIKDGRYSIDSALAEAIIV